MGVAIILFTIAAMVALYILVLPKSKDGHFNNKFLQWMHDFFHMKKLYLESVLRFFYILSTVAAIVAGFFTMFMVGDMGGYAILAGLGIMIFSPFVIRLAYESMMMLIMAVKNIMEINKKLGPKAPEEPKAPVAPKAPAAPSYAPPAPKAPTYAPPAPKAPTYAPPTYAPPAPPVYPPRPAAPAPRPAAPTFAPPVPRDPEGKL